MLMTAVFAAVHLTVQGSEAEGMIRIDGELIPVTALPLVPVTGTVVNGKGQETRIDAPGVALSSLFDGDVTVTSSDLYAATVSAEELDRAYLILDGERVRLTVFGDTDARRNVKNVTEVRGA